MQFLDLTDDVFLYICDYLTGSYALDFALTCKRLYSFAINRATITFIASSLRGLQAFHRCVLHSSPSRVQYVKRLEITHDVLADNGYPHTGISQDSVEVLVDLLRHTHNLTRLSLHCVHLMLQYYPHIALPALLGLRNLTHLQIYAISDDNVKLIGESGWDIRALSLDYTVYKPRNIWTLGPHISYHVLIEAIAKLPHLYSLRLRAFEPRGWSVPIPGDGHTPISGTFPSIRRLFMIQSRIIPTLDLISRCPNLDVLDISNVTKEDDLTEHQFVSWPPLRSLRCDVCYVNEACESHVVDVSTALHLHVSDILTVVDANGGAGGGHGDGNEDGNGHGHVDGGVNEDKNEDDSEDVNDIPALLSMLQKVSPMWLQVALIVGGTPMRFWKDVPSLAPRLRYLELKIVLKDVKEEYADWLKNVPSALSSLPLYHLKLYISELPTAETIWNRVTGEFLRDSNGPYVHSATKEGAFTFAFYAACVATAETLPDRCARAIPTLKFFVLSDKGDLEQFERARRAIGGEPQDGFILPIGQQEAKEGADADEEIVEIKEACETDDCSYMHAWLSDGEPGTIRSWRIARDATGDGVRLHRLKLNQGRRLERCLNACFDDKDPFDDIATFYRDSDPEAS